MHWLKLVRQRVGENKKKSSKNSMQISPAAGARGLNQLALASPALDTAF